MDIQFDDIKINQQIYFLTSSNKLYEKYVVNGNIVKRMLGYISNGIYFPMKSLEQQYIRRRQDFQGLEMIAMTEEALLNIKLASLEEAIYFPENQTYEVTKLVSGSYFDIWTHLEKTLNFTTKLYRRKDKRWGVPVQLQNGTIELVDGVIKDVMSGIADAIVSSPAIMLDRYLVVDYLHPITTNKGGVYVKTEDLLEGFDFEVFWKQFEEWTWLTLIFTSALISVSIVFIWKVFNGNVKVVPSIFWVMLISPKSNMGSDSFENLRYEQ